MQIAGGREAAGVEVGMRVQPENAQLASALAAMPCHGADRTQAQAMVAAHEQRQITRGKRRMDRIMHGKVPCQHFVQVAVTA